MKTTERTAKIAALNDALRTGVNQPENSGFMVQDEVVALESGIEASVIHRLKTYSTFADGSQRDVGSFISDAGRIVWLITYHHDDTITYIDVGHENAPDPADPATFRVLHVMLLDITHNVQAQASLEALMQKITNEMCNLAVSDADKRKLRELLREEAAIIMGIMVFESRHGYTGPSGQVRMLVQDMSRRMAKVMVTMGVE